MQYQSIKVGQSAIFAHDIHENKRYSLYIKISTTSYSENYGSMYFIGPSSDINQTSPHFKVIKVK